MKTHPHSILRVPTTQLAKMNIDLKFVELTADVLEHYLQNIEWGGDSCLADRDGCNNNSVMIMPIGIVVIVDVMIAIVIVTMIMIAIVMFAFRQCSVGSAALQ